MTSANPYHGLSLEQIDSLLGVVRESTMDRLKAAGARAARDAASSLEEGTLNYQDAMGGQHELLRERATDAGPDAWRVTQTFYSSGVCEVRCSLGNVWTRGQRKSASESPTPEKSLGELEAVVRFESSISRAKKRLRARCLELQADHLLTLGKRGKFKTIDDAWRAFAKFSRLMTKFYGDKWRYVVVPELHKDGETYHVHVAIRGFYWVGMLRKFWQRALGGKGDERGESSLGNIDVKSFRRVRGASGARRIAGYIAKYVGKGFTSRNRGRRLFAASGGLNPHRVERWVVRHWLGVRELAFAMQARLVGAGSSGAGTCYFWSRERRDGSMMSMGFVLSSDWKGVEL